MNELCSPWLCSPRKPIRISIIKQSAYSLKGEAEKGGEMS